MNIFYVVKYKKSQKGSIILKFKGVIFDLDGTLANTIVDLRNAVCSGIEKLGFPLPSLEEYPSFVGEGTDKMITYALKQNATKENIAFVKKCYLKFYAEHFADTTYAYEGMKELVLKLKEQGVKLAVVSNKVDHMTVALVNKLFPNCFSVIFGQKDGLPTKPDPTLTLLAVEKLGLNKEDCAFVGDSGSDALTGINAGLYPVGVLWGYRDKKDLIEKGAKALANTVNELENILL